MFEPPKNKKSTFTKFYRVKLRVGVIEGNLFCPKFGDYGLQARVFGRLNAAQLEAGRLVVRRFSKKQAFLKINVYPFLAFTKKPIAVRMGKGKGRSVGWICPVKRGRIIYEISSCGGKFRDRLPFLALRLVNKKLPIKSRVVRLIY